MKSNGIFYYFGQENSQLDLRLNKRISVSKRKLSSESCKLCFFFTFKFRPLPYQKLILAKVSKLDGEGRNSFNSMFNDSENCRSDRGTIAKN